MLRRSILLAPLAALPARSISARAEAPDRLAVVATFSILADMVREVGGEAVRVVSLVPPDGDPHHYEPKPSALRELHAAKLVVTNGLGLEGFMDRLVQASGYAGPVVVAALGVAARTLPGRSTPDPHAWQDPRNGVIYARNVEAGLVRADPAHAEAYHARAAAYVQRIAETEFWIEQQLAPVAPNQRKILTSHDAFGYFGARFGIEFIGIEGVNTEAEPSAAEIAALIRLVRRDHIKAVFVENMTNPGLSRTLARETGAVVGGTVYSDALSPPGGPADTYLKMFRHNLSLFVPAMLAN